MLPLGAFGDRCCGGHLSAHHFIHWLILWPSTNAKFKSNCLCPTENGAKPFNYLFIFPFWCILFPNDGSLFLTLPNNKNYYTKIIFGERCWWRGGWLRLIKHCELWHLWWFTLTTTYQLLFYWLLGRRYQSSSKTKHHKAKTLSDHGKAKTLKMKH